MPNTKVSPKRNKNLRRHLLLGAAGVVIVVGVLGALQALHVTHFFGYSKQEQIQQENKLNNEKKAQTATNPSSSAGDKSSPDNNSSPPYTPPASSNNITLSASKTSANSVTVYTKLYGYSDGTCTLDISNGAQKTTQAAPVIFQSQYSTCAGFSVPVNPLGSGTWTITLSVLSGGNTVTKSITYEVAP